jgi:branched-subunit amino acid aminotransferase/4-amino-4-deoxychorismate lyase
MTALPPDPYLDLNGRLVRSSEARISPLGEGFLYGRGLFETIKVLDGQLAFFPEHVARLRRGAAELGLGAVPAETELRVRCARLLLANGLQQGSVKLVAFADAGSDGQLMLLREPTYGPAVYARGYRLQTVGEGPRAGGLGALKTLNYLRNLSAKRAAQAAGYDEPLFVAADGAALEGATSNVFAVKDGAIRTPPADGGILPGIARAQLLTLLRDRGAAEGRIDAEWLRGADEVFVTNSLLGVMPVSHLDQQRYDLDRNIVSRAAMAAWQVAERRSAESAGV